MSIASAAKNRGYIYSDVDASGDVYFFNENADESMLPVEVPAIMLNREETGRACRKVPLSYLYYGTSQSLSNCMAYL